MELRHMTTILSWEGHRMLIITSGRVLHVQFMGQQAICRETIFVDGIIRIQFTKCAFHRRREGSGINMRQRRTMQNQLDLGCIG